MSTSHRNGNAEIRAAAGSLLPGIAELAQEFRRGTPSQLSSGWEHDPAVLAAHQLLARELIGRLPSSPPPGDGRGIVICGGGARLFSNAWVCIRMLRHLGCTLPIRLWYLTDSELDEPMRRLVASYGVETCDARTLLSAWPARRLNGWELKAYALLYCEFREVLLLDADNVPVVDPTFLFDTPQFRETGAVFWPDFGRLGPERSIWALAEVPYRDEPEFESGQILIDKARVHRALRLALHYNEHSDLYYCHVHGDKETFHLAFRRLEQPYSMPQRGIVALDATMCQHDFRGRRIFQHRNMDKWRLDGSNRAIPGFLHEDLCRRFLAELRETWSGRIWWNQPPSGAERSLIHGLAGTYRYERVGHDQRVLELQADRTIGQGAAGQEQAWTVHLVAGQPSLVLLSTETPTCRCLPESPGTWIGRWLQFEQMPIRLTRLGLK